MKATTKLAIDPAQNMDANDRVFGYIYASGTEEGGYFFTWFSSDEETINSVEVAAEESEPDFSAEEAKKFLAEKLASGLRRRAQAKMKYIPEAV